MHKPSSVRSLPTLSPTRANPPFFPSFSFSLSFPSSSPHAPARSLQLARPLLLAFSFLFRLLPLSATHLCSVNPFHCENVVLQSALSPTPPSSPAPFVFSLVLSSLACLHRLSFSTLCYSRTLCFLVGVSFFFSLSLSLYLEETLVQPSFPSLHSRSSFARCTVLFDESSRSTSGYLTPLINGDVRLSDSEARKVEWSLSLLTFACEAGSGGFRCNDTKPRDHKRLHYHFRSRV